MEFSGKTRVCGVIGDPIEHTLSPLIHNAAFRSLKLDFVFVAFRVRKADLGNAINSVRSLGIHGLNVTMPHKNAVIKYLNEIDSAAKFLGSVNTIHNDNGKLLGFNTDGVGAVKALQENGADLKNRKLLLLGAGGAAKAIAFYAAKEAKELVILNRSPEKAESFAKVLRGRFGKKIVGGSLSPNLMKENLQDSDILINATSVGMSPKTNESLVSRQWLKPNLYVMDIVYSPLETRLAKDAKEIGAKIISGVEMLIYQGAVSFEIWTGRSAPVEVMKKAVLNRLSEKGDMA